MISSRKWAWALLGALLAGCAGGGVTPGMLRVAQQRWSDSSAESLERGRALFRDKCKTCHALPDPKAHTADEWPKILDKMSKLAELDPAGRQSVERYLVAARESE